MTEEQLNRKRFRDRMAKRRSRARARGVPLPPVCSRGRPPRYVLPMALGQLGGWVHRAACKGQGHLFFSEVPDDQDAAVLICAGCPVLAECNAYANQAGEQWGVWAGVLREKPAPRRAAA